MSAFISILGLGAILGWLLYRFGPTICRVAGIAYWWAGWCCGSQGGYGYMAFLLIIGTALWVVGTRWYARRRGYWPSRMSARLLDRHSSA